MATTFFLALDFGVGKSLVERDKVDLAQSLMAKAGSKLILPRGAVVAPSLERANERREVLADQIPPDYAVFDIDKGTQLDFRARILQAKTVFWNGPMGVFETPPFDQGTRAVAEALVEAGKRGAITVVGGGDSAAAVRGFEERHHVSTGGGAFAEFLEGKPLPGVARSTKREKPALRRKLEDSPRPRRRAHYFQTFCARTSATITATSGSSLPQYRWKPRPGRRTTGTISGSARRMCIGSQRVHSPERCPSRSWCRLALEPLW